MYTTSSITQNVQAILKGRQKKQEDRKVNIQDRISYPKKSLQNHKPGKNTTKQGLNSIIASNFEKATP